MTLSMKLSLAALAFVLVGFAIYQWIVGSAIIGALYDGVCMIFPVCPGL